MTQPTPSDATTRGGRAAGAAPHAVPVLWPSAAAHVAFDAGEPVLVRLICASGCADNDTAHVAVIDAIYGVPAA